LTSIVPGLFEQFKDFVILVCLDRFQQGIMIRLRSGRDCRNVWLLAIILTALAGGGRMGAAARAAKSAHDDWCK
jgi:hypothetical protein